MKFIILFLIVVAVVLPILTGYAKLPNSLTPQELGQFFRAIGQYYQQLFDSVFAPDQMNQGERGDLR